MWAKRWDVDHEVEEKAEEPTTWRHSIRLFERLTRQTVAHDTAKSREK